VFPIGHSVLYSWHSFPEVFRLEARISTTVYYTIVLMRRRATLWRISHTLQCLSSARTAFICRVSAVHIRYNDETWNNGPDHKASGRTGRGGCDYCRRYAFHKEVIKLPETASTSNPCRWNGWLRCRCSARRCGSQSRDLGR
jgi:hypothetical protein